MKLVKIPRREWPTWKTMLAQHYYVARAFDPCTEQLRALVNDWGAIVGAISYSIETDHVRVYSLGVTLQKRGLGSRLMAHVERRARKLGVPVRLSAERSAVGFYEGRGYKKLPGQKKTCRVFYMVRQP